MIAFNQLQKDALYETVDGQLRILLDAGKARGKPDWQKRWANVEYIETFNLTTLQYEQFIRHAWYKDKTKKFEEFINTATML